MPKPTPDAPLDVVLGYFLSEYLDDNAPVNQRLYENAARAAIEQLHLTTATPDDPAPLPEVTIPGPGLKVDAPHRCIGPASSHPCNCGIGLDHDHAAHGRMMDAGR